MINLKVKESRFLNCNKDALALIKTFSSALFLAGGYFRSWINKSEPISDYDIFFTDLSVKDSAIGFLESAGFEKVFVCPLGELVTMKKEGVKIQFITKQSYHSVRDCIGTFDLTACCAGYCFKSSKFHCHDDWAPDVKRKMIAFNAVTYPVASIGRIVKYHQKGYRYTQETLKHFVLQIAGKEFNDQTLALYVD